MARAEVDISRDSAFIANPDDWPNWPRLPVVYVGDDPDMQKRGVGVIFADSLLRVYGGLNLFGGWTPEEVKNAPKYDYPNFNELATSWRVD